MERPTVCGDVPNWLSWTGASARVPGDRTAIGRGVPEWLDARWQTIRDVMSTAFGKSVRRAIALAALPLPLSLAMPGTASAQATGPAPLDTIVVTATRTPTPVDRVPASVSVVTRADIERNAWATLPEALRTLPGMTVVSSGGAGANTSVFMRGNNSDHVLVLLDGMPINDPSASAGAFNFGDDLLGGFSRIEVVRGPASSLYGSNAIGGVVNLITAAGADRPAVATAEAAAGTQSTWRGAAGLRGTVDRFDYGVTLDGFTTAGRNNTPARFATRNLGEADGFENLTATAKGVLRLNRVRLEGLLRWRDARFDLDSVPTDDPNYKGESRQTAWQVAAEGDPLTDRLTTRLAVGQSRTDRSFTNARDALSVGTNDDDFDSVRTHVDLQNTLALPDAGGFDDGTLAFGGSYAHEKANFRTRSTSAFGPFNQDVDATADSRAMFAHVQARVAGLVDVTAGVRYDSPDDFGDRATWRIGAVAPLPGTPVRLKASAGSGYKAPTLYDRYGRTNFGYRGNPDLDAERSTAWEAGIEADLPGMGRADLAALSAAYFSSNVDKLIQFDFVRNTSINIAKADIQGVETAATLRPADGVSMTATWTWTDARNAQTGQRLLRRPEHQVTLAGTTKVGTVTLSPEAQYIGRRLDVVYTDAGGFVGNRAVEGYWRANLAVAWRAAPNVELFARGANLFDRRIEDPNGFAQPGRALTVGARARF